LQEQSPPLSPRGRVFRRHRRERLATPYDTHLKLGKLSRVEPPRPSFLAAPALGHQTRLSGGGRQYDRGGLIRAGSGPRPQDVSVGADSLGRPLVGGDIAPRRFNRRPGRMRAAETGMKRRTCSSRGARRRSPGGLSTLQKPPNAAAASLGVGAPVIFIG